MHLIRANKSVLDWTLNALKTQPLGQWTKTGYILIRGTHHWLDPNGSRMTWPTCNFEYTFNFFQRRAIRKALRHARITTL